MKMNHHLSREIAAGYDPDRLTQMRVLLVGAGALGQNIGLNLALAQKILQLHEGRISVENLPEGGCRVRMLLPGEQGGN